MKKYLLLVVVLVFTLAGFAQEEEKKEDKPVRTPFTSGYLLDNQTTFISYPKTFGFYIQHKFGTIENGTEDMFGIYSSANVRLALDYVVIKNLQVGYGLTKTGMTHDFNVKYTILEQTRKNTIPVAVAVYGNMGIMQGKKETFGADYDFTDRMSYFGQVIISRKFTDRISLQTGASFSHFNQVDTANMSFDRVGLHVNGRVKVTEQGSIQFNVDYPLKVLVLRSQEDKDVFPNLSLGYEIATISHQFQIFLGYSNEILPQHYMINPAEEFDFSKFRVGFVITRMHNF
ncbi:MAG: hypothetical protein JEZ09_16705 [Salinivirgaceae bacterium]|nr:hypothetical protein [Salinivirgaceae bacterium]